MSTVTTNTAIALLCRKPHRSWLDFLSTFKKYDVYVIINNTDYIIDETYANTNIKFIKIDKKECSLSGYKCSIQVPTLPVFPEIVAWDQALYYFSCINTTYDHVWFVEDDCFFICEETIENLDKKYPDEDLLTKSHNVYTEETPKGWCHWPHIVDLIPPPRCESLIQTCRLSKTLLEKMKEYVNINKRLFFIESMFNTIAHQTKCKIANSKELKTLTLVNSRNIRGVNSDCIYHCVKNMDDHPIIRKTFYMSQNIEKS